MWRKYHISNLVLIFIMEKYDLVLIFLHGVGSSGSSWRARLLDCLRKSSCKIRLITPTAPIDSVTMFGGIKMNSWFDMTNFGNTYREIKEIKSAAQVGYNELSFNGQLTI